MNTLDIICDSCDAQMRLSAGLLARVAGKTGRVSCKQCEQRVILDGRDGGVRVVAGGTVVEPLDLEEVQSSADGDGKQEAGDPHLSELPPDVWESRGQSNSSLPPPLPEEAKKDSNSPPAMDEPPPSAEELTDVASVREPGLFELADQLRRAEDREPRFEAPSPLRAGEDSLSPHSIDDEEEDGLVSLNRDFRSSPFASERDATYESLFPKNSRITDPAIFEAPVPLVSGAPRPPKAGELRRSRAAEADALAADLSKPAGQVSMLVGPDGNLHNRTDEQTMTTAALSAAPAPQRSSWFPWMVAAVSLLALGISIGMHARDGGVALQSPLEKAEAHRPTLAGAPFAEEEVIEPTVEEDVIDDIENELAEEDAIIEDSVGTESESVEKQADLTVKKAEAKKAEATTATATKEEGSSDESKDLVEDETNGEPVDSEAEESEEADGEMAPAPQFSASAASAALREATALASSCRSPSDPTGNATVVVTFAPSGRVTRAAVTGEPYAGTTTGGCIASRFRSARVPAFSGDFVTVKKTVTIN